LTEREADTSITDIRIPQIDILYPEVLFRDIISETTEMLR
jgi:hypothetical protein